MTNEYCRYMFSVKKIRIMCKGKSHFEGHNIFDKSAYFSTTVYSCTLICIEVSACKYNRKEI